MFFFEKKNKENVFFCTYEKLEFKFQADQFLIKGYLINIRRQTAVSYTSVSWSQLFTVFTFSD